MPTNNGPLVSVICCTHNRPAFARKAVDLFLQQTYQNREMVLMDDGDPKELVDLGRQPGVRRVHTSGYEGMTRKQRWGFSIARGEYVGYWDDDDWFSPKRLEIQATALTLGSADVVGFPVDRIATVPSGRFWTWAPAKASAPAAAEPAAVPARRTEPIPFHDGSSMWRRSLLQGIPENFLEASQLDLLNEMRRRGARLRQLPNQGTFVYVRHGGNAWRFDEREKLTEVERPGWIPPGMVEFWKRADLATNGGARV